jgi:hypothetical protein
VDSATSNTSTNVVIIVRDVVEHEFLTINDIVWLDVSVIHIRFFTHLVKIDVLVVNSLLEATVLRNPVSFLIWSVVRWIGYALCRVSDHIFSHLIVLRLLLQDVLSLAYHFGFLLLC